MCFRNHLPILVSAQLLQFHGVCASRCLLVAAVFADVAQLRPLPASMSISRVSWLASQKPTASACLQADLDSYLSPNLVTSPPAELAAQKSLSDLRVSGPQLPWLIQ